MATSRDGYHGHPVSCRHILMMPGMESRVLSTLRGCSNTELHPQVLYFERRSWSPAQADLELVVPLLQPAECQDYRVVPLHQVFTSLMIALYNPLWHRLTEWKQTSLSIKPLSKSQRCKALSLWLWSQELCDGFHKTFQKVGCMAERPGIQVWGRRGRDLLLPLLVSFLENVNDSESSSWEIITLSSSWPT